MSSIVHLEFHLKEMCTVADTLDTAYEQSTLGVVNAASFPKLYGYWGDGTAVDDLQRIGFVKKFKLPIGRGQCWRVLYLKGRAAIPVFGYAATAICAPLTYSYGVQAGLDSADRLSDRSGQSLLRGGSVDFLAARGVGMKSICRDPIAGQTLFEYVSDCDIRGSDCVYYNWSRYSGNDLMLYASFSVPDNNTARLGDATAVGGTTAQMLGLCDMYMDAVVEIYNASGVDVAMSMLAHHPAPTKGTDYTYPPL